MMKNPHTTDLPRSVATFPFIADDTRQTGLLYETELFIIIYYKVFMYRTIKFTKHSTPPNSLPDKHLQAYACHITHLCRDS